MEIVPRGEQLSAKVSAKPVQSGKLIQSVDVKQKSDGVTVKNVVNSTNRAPIPKAISRGFASSIHSQDSVEDESDVFIDTTENLVLHSKRLERQQKRRAVKAAKLAEKQFRASLLRLPGELLLQVLERLQPTVLMSLQLVNRELRAIIQEHDVSLSKRIIANRFPLLSKCFSRPVPLRSVDTRFHPALLNERRLKVMRGTHMCYEHLPPVDPEEFCTCVTCVQSWNNLCLIVDYAHWQKHYDIPSQAVPRIERGTKPEWNQKLLARQAEIVRRSVESDLVYATLLQIHLRSINRAIGRYKPKKDCDEYLYGRTKAEADSGVDDFLSREGPHSNEFPWIRFQYQLHVAYVPKRFWLKSEQRWGFFRADQHDRDLEAIATYFTPHEGS